MQVGGGSLALAYGYRYIKVRSRIIKSEVLDVSCHAGEWHSTQDGDLGMHFKS